MILVKEMNMTLTRFSNPFLVTDPFQLFEQTVNKVLNEPAATRPWTPAVDIFETENEVILKAIDIRIEDGTLSLKGERKFVQEKKEGGYHRTERSYGSFARYFSLPETVDPERVKADYKSGVLTVTLAKKEAAKPKQIKIELQ